jgi:resolvase-like protein
VTGQHIYSDDGISGAEFANRPGLVRLLAALKPKPAFQVLIVSEESRLGRESIETAYVIKQLVTAGVRLFFYLEDRERTLDTPIDKIMLQLTNFADEMERERARSRTYDAMVRMATAGHVTGGSVLGMTTSTLQEPYRMPRAARNAHTLNYESTRWRPRSCARLSGSTPMATASQQSPRHSMPEVRSVRVPAPLLVSRMAGSVQQFGKYSCAASIAESVYGDA